MDESATPAREWHDFCSLEEIPDGGILTRLQGGKTFSSIAMARR